MRTDMSTVTVVHVMITAMSRQVCDKIKVRTVCQGKLSRENGLKMEENAHADILKGCVQNYCWEKWKAT